MFTHGLFWLTVCRAHAGWLTACRRSKLVSLRIVQKHWWREVGRYNVIVNSLNCYTPGSVGWARACLAHVFYCVVSLRLRLVVIRACFVPAVPQRGCLPGARLSATLKAPLQAHGGARRCRHAGTADVCSKHIRCLLGAFWVLLWLLSSAFTAAGQKMVAQSSGA